MFTEINPRLASWSIFNTLVGLIIVICFLTAYRGDYSWLFVDLCFIPIFIWALFYGRRPRLILKESTITLSLFLYTKELPYDSISNLFLLETKRNISHGVRERWSPRFLYLFVLLIAIILFCILFSTKSFYYSVRVSFFFTIASGIAIELIYFLMFLFDKILGRIDLGEMNLAIRFSSTSFTEFPFSYYNKRPLCYRIRAIFPDITEQQYIDLVKILRLKLDSKVFNL